MNFFFTALKSCDLYSTRTYDYTTFHAIDNIGNKSVKNDDYYVKFVFHVIAKEDVHVLLAESPTDTRSSYEIGRNILN